MGRKIQFPMLHKKDWLYEEHVECGRSLREIAEMLGCSESWVSQMLKYHGITCRRVYSFDIRTSEEKADHFARSADCYIEKARRLLRGERVDPSCEE